MNIWQTWWWICNNMKRHVWLGRKENKKMYIFVMLKTKKLLKWIPCKGCTLMREGTYLTTCWNLHCTFLSNILRFNNMKKWIFMVFFVANLQKLLVIYIISVTFQVLTINQGTLYTSCCWKGGNFCSKI